MGIPAERLLEFEKIKRAPKSYLKSFIDLHTYTLVLFSMIYILFVTFYLYVATLHAIFIHYEDIYEKNLFHKTENLTHPNFVNRQ